VNIIIKNKINEEILENEIVAVRSITSASMLIEGGAPKFLAARINHQIVRAGNKFINPLIISIFRVVDVSYVMLAREKSAEEIKPWAIIKSKAPDQPHKFIEKIPAVTRPI